MGSNLQTERGLEVEDDNRSSGLDRGLEHVSTFLSHWKYGRPWWSSDCAIDMNRTQRMICIEKKNINKSSDSIRVCRSRK